MSNEVELIRIREALEEQNKLLLHKNTILSKIYDVLYDIYGGMP